MSAGGHLQDPHHDGSALYVPPGTPRLGDVVPVRVRVPRGATESSVHLRTVRDGEPVLVPARRDGTRGGDRWYVAEVVVHNPVTSYRFLVDEGRGHRWLNGTGLHARDVADTADFRLTVHAPAPAWARDAIVYQVFPDRFAPSGLSSPAPSWALPAAWGDEPVAAGPATSRQLYGGDLLGIEQHLDHLQGLGADVLYLTPFFPAGSSHRYDATTFDHVDPLLGGDAALASLSRAVHARGMRLMGDLTTNHTGVQHEWFVRARSDRGSEEATFYHWSDEPPGWVGWLGHASLPKLDHTAAGVAAALTDGPGSVVDRWMREPYSLDGWRIDVANMTGRYRDIDLAREVARTIRRTMHSVNPSSLLVSEHFHDAGADLAGDGWQANMNYTGFARPVWGWLTPQDAAHRAPGLPVRAVRRPGSAMVASMREFSAAVPWSVASNHWNLLGSHDTPRIRTLTGSPEMVRVAVGLLMTYPGTPMVFAGDEIGATGSTGEHARVTMPWADADRWDQATLEVYRSLISVRKASRALREGGLRWVAIESDAVAFLRETMDERVLVVVSRAPWAGARIPLDLLAPGGPTERLYGSSPLVVDGKHLVLAGERPGVDVWRLA